MSPLRHIFPETLYWDPDVERDAQGRLLLDLLLADSLTTWQVTALASTLDGAIGAASLPLALEIAAMGERSGDRVLVELEVVR